MTHPDAVYCKNPFAMLRNREDLEAGAVFKTPAVKLNQEIETALSIVAESGSVLCYAYLWQAIT